MHPDADFLVDYAIEHSLDSVLLNSINALRSFDDDYLAAFERKLNDNDLGIYVGIGSIGERLMRSNDMYGQEQELLRKGIRVAAAIGSSVLGCRIGSIEDRYAEGGIEPQMEIAVQHMRALRSEALDAGVKFAFENHAGDLRAEEVVIVIEATGTDICGALFDCGNAIYALEDPMHTLEVLGPDIVCTSVRDVTLWPSEDGAIFQWTAIGDGLLDFPLLAERLGTLSPGVPLHVETISNDPRSIPFLTDEFWKGFPELDASDLVDFLKLLRRGEPVEVLQPPSGVDQNTFDIEHQKLELEASLDYLRRHCNAGLKT